VSLDAAAFERVRKLVYERTAIVLDEGKEYLVESRLSAIAYSHGYRDVNALCRDLEPRRGALLAEVVEAMTTNETSFFRDHHPFEALRTVVIPELIAKRKHVRKLRVWCAACSSGQEPYSTALLIDQEFPELASWNVTIYATDVARNMVARAASGRYRQVEINRGLSAPMLVKYFAREGLEWELAAHIRRRVVFAELNLISDWPSMETFDLVLLRNVLIYFDQPTKQAVLERVRRQVADDGYLMLGGSETMPNEVRSFERVPIARAGLFRTRRPSQEAAHAR
jgi:chemotaxis protein methyltransferase CheR